METISGYVKGKKVIRSSQRGFIKGQSYLTNLTIYDAMTSLVDERRAVNIFYLEFNKAFDTVPCKIIIEKLIKYGLDEKTMR